MIDMNIWIYNRLLLIVLLMMIILIMRGGGVMFLHSESRLEMSDVLIKIIKKWKKTANILVWKTEKRESNPGDEHCFPICAVSLSVGEKVTYPGQRWKSRWLNLSIFSLKNLFFFGIMTKFIFWESSLIDVRMVILARCLILHREHWERGKIKPL